jgi:hypothetical protein
MANITVEISGAVADKLRLLVEAEQTSEADLVGDALAVYYTPHWAE